MKPKYNFLTNKSWNWFDVMHYLLHGSREEIKQGGKKQYKSDILYMASNAFCEKENLQTKSSSISFK